MRIGQLLTIGIAGTSLSDSEKKFISENDIGGVILMGRNIKDPQQAHQLCSEIYELSQQSPQQTPILISVDQEGGRVARLKAPFTLWPPAKKLGDIDSPNTSFQMSYCMGRELNAIGIHLDFAPCADVFSNPKNTVIGDRAISNDPEMVAKHISGVIRGFMKSGVIPCAKHFPGHGNTLLDSHEDLPIEEADLARLESFELIPFKKAIKSRIDFIMTSHILFKNIDPQWPATLSEKFLKEILQNQLRYKGIIISDDMDMKAMTKKYSKELIPVQALRAGVDMLLYCNEPESPVIALAAIRKAIQDGSLLKNLIQDKIQKILSFKKDYFSLWKPYSWQEAQSMIATPEHQTLSENIRNGLAYTGTIES